MYPQEEIDGAAVHHASVGQDLSPAPMEIGNMQSTSVILNCNWFMRNDLHFLLRRIRIPVCKEISDHKFVIRKVIMANL